MKSSIISSWDTFLLLEEQWNALLFRSRATSVFLTWEWINCWRSLAVPDVVPHIVVVQNSAGAIVGIAPYYISSLQFMKTVRYRTLRVLGDTASGAEYADWIIEPSLEQPVSRQIVDAMLQTKHDWDTLWMPRVASWTGAQSRLYDSVKAAGLPVHMRGSDFSAIKLPNSIEDYDAKFSSKRRQKMRREQKKLLQIKGFEYISCVSAGELSRILAALFDLHQRRWRSIGQDGVFVRRPRMARQFYEEFTPIALSKGWLSVHAIRQDSTWKAVQLGYIFDKKYCQLQEGFDPDFLEGIGNVLRHRMIGELIRQGVSEYDFLGGWSEHKRRWGAEKREGVDMFVSSGKLKTKPLFAREFWPSGRFIDEL